MDNRIVHFVNVYAGCAIRGKRALWQNLILEKARLNPSSWVIGGDFNTVTSKSDIKGRSVKFSSVESQTFRHFMAEMEVVELPCLGKKILLVSTKWSGG